MPTHLCCALLGLWGGRWVTREDAGDGELVCGVVGLHPPPTWTCRLEPTREVHLHDIKTMGQ